MPHNHQDLDYEPVTHSRRRQLWEGEPAEATSGWTQGAGDISTASDDLRTTTEHLPLPAPPATVAPEMEKENWSAKRGHAISYLGVSLFTVIVYFRPYEFSVALYRFNTMAYWVAIFTLIVFIPTQLSLEGTLTARPREVNLMLLLFVAGLLSIPLASYPPEAWETFNDSFIKAFVMFIIMVNVLRTERRLKWLIFIALAVSCWLSLNAIGDYRLGLFEDRGARIEGSIKHGLFENANDMALHLVTMVPITIALALSARNPLSKLIYGACGVLIVAGMLVTFSRGGFIGFAAVMAFLAMKLGRQRRIGVIVLGMIGLFLLLSFAPGGYGSRMASIFGGDATGSSSQRQAILIRSIVVALRHPLFGVGMGNFHHHSFKELVSHNSYTQVASEMGIAAMVIYTMFIVSPFKRLGQIAREILATGEKRSRFYYLAVGLQASLVGFMVTSFFASVAYLWYPYYLVAYAVALRRIYETGPGASVQAIASAESSQAGNGSQGATVRIVSLNERAIP